jgi:site-specific recombinase XerD
MAKSQQPLRSHLLPFVDYCEIEKGLANTTQRNYRQYLKVFFSWLDKTHRAELRPRELTAKHVWDYRLYLARSYKTPGGRYLTKKSQNLYLMALRALVRYLAERDIETFPSTKITLAKQKSEAPVSFLERKEVERMLKQPDTAKPEGLRDRAIMETLFSSGMRIAELVALDVEQVAALMQERQETERTLELPIIGKGKHIRTIFISPRAGHWIRAYLASRRDDLKPLFINSRSRNPESKRLTPRAIQLLIAKYARLGGLSKKVTPHTMRHTYATDLLSRGADLRSVQELLGHKNVSTTQIYPTSPISACATSMSSSMAAAIRGGDGC